MKLLPIAASMMKYVGFGTAVVTAERLAEVDDPSIIDAVPFIVGMVAWVGGLCAEYFLEQTPVIIPEQAVSRIDQINQIANARKNGTYHTLLSRTLKYSAGVGAARVGSDLIFSEGELMDTVSIGAMAFVASITAVEMMQALYQPRPVVIPLSGVRTLISFVSHFFLVSFAENYIRNRPNPIAGPLLIMGLTLVLCESLTSNQNDKFITSQSVGRRQMMKLTLALGPLNTLIDFVQGKFDPHTVTANTYLLFNDLLIIMAFITMGKIERNNPRPFPKSLVSDESIKELFQKSILSCFKLPVVKSVQVYNTATGSWRTEINPDYDDEFDLTQISQNRHGFHASRPNPPAASLQMAPSNSTEAANDGANYNALDDSDEKERLNI